MARKYFLFIMLLATGTTVFSQIRIFDKPLSPRIANYAMKARLFPETKTVDASYLLNWWNASNDTIRELQFHLYLNAFKNEKSTFIRESGGRHRSGEIKPEKENWGFIDVLSMQMIDGEDLTTKIEFIHPDDDNADDQTVIRVPLSNPILPSQSIQIECKFRSKLPRVSARTGFSDDKDDFFLVGQWFPKIGVWRNGAWNCHQFHSQTEFFADFGVYDMELTVPKQYIVGANAVLVDKKEMDSLSVYTFHQEDVIDAVWTASSKFTEIKQKVKIASTGREVDVTYLLAPGREVYEGRYFNASTAMFNYFDEWFGTYPYPNLTIVDPPVGEGMTAGGMEYPTLVTTGSFFGSARTNDFIGLNILEIVTFHEFAHNYFQSLVANNEFEEPWLDEGFTTYAEHRALERYEQEGKISGGYGNIFGLNFSSIAYHRLSYLPTPRNGIVGEKAWKIPENFYQTAAYSKPVLLLTTLQNYLGEETMNKVMRAYFDRWKFRHPQTKDFIAVVNEVSGQDLNWYFDQFVYTHKTVDFEVSGIRVFEIKDQMGWFGDSEEKIFTEDQKEIKNDSAETPIEKKYRSVISVRNNGEALFPTTILIRFANGDSVIEKWDGKDSPKQFAYDKNTKAVSASIDPDRINVLDLKITNNTKVVEAELTGISRYTARFLFWLQSVFQTLIMIV
ncbi:M1 family metallopeptidase [bacterium]|nr:M1 family metallopeptidase [bacterium]